MIAQFEALCSQMANDFPASRPKLTTFPSGAALLDFKVGFESYTFEFLPSLQSFGLSKTDNAVYGWEGVEHPFKDFHTAKSFIWDLLQTTS